MPTSLFLSLLDKRPIIIFRCYLKKYKCFYFLTCNTSVKTWNKIFPVDTQVINAIGFYIYPKEMFKCQKTLRSAPNLSPNRQNKIDLVISDLSLKVNHLNINLIPLLRVNLTVELSSSLHLSLCYAASQPLLGGELKKISFNQNNEFILSNIIDRKNTKSVCTISSDIKSRRLENLTQPSSRYVHTSIQYLYSRLYRWMQLS